ncbi:MAG TPA: hypothetical protein DDZ37_02410 [Spirochaetaceae bacterium]|nr:hypothetical protein [Spirochaetaceae bacterium]
MAQTYPILHKKIKGEGGIGFITISSLLGDTLKTGDKEDWPYYDSIINAPLSINLMFSLCVVSPLQ